MRTTTNQNPMRRILTATIVMWVSAFSASSVLAVEDEMRARDKVEQINGLALWLDASATESIMRTDDDHVRTWADWRNGVELEATSEDTADAPRWIAKGINGRAALRFEGGRLTLSCDDALDMTRDVSGVTVVAVTYSRGEGVESILRIAEHEKPGGARIYLYRGSNDHRVGGRRKDEDSYQAVSGGRRAEGPVIEAGILTYEHQRAFVYVDGIAVASSEFQSPGRTSDTRAASFVVGDRYQGGHAFDGKIAEVLVFTRALTWNDHLVVGAYLAEKYEIEAYTPKELPWRYPREQEDY